MIHKSTNPLSKITLALTFIGVLTANALANILPINGVGTGEVSDAYPNLFAPAGVTFAIWGLIYFLLAVYTLSRLLRKTPPAKEALLVKVDALFSISSVANMVWIFAWHYQVIWLSLILMLAILLCLIGINLILRRETYPIGEHFRIKLPFTIYFGWITVATIANVTTWLVDRGWTQIAQNEVLWTVAMILTGALIGSVTALHFKSKAYGLVIIWAYIGIMIKHVSETMFNLQYPAVLVATAVSIAALAAVEALLFRSSKRL